MPRTSLPRRGMLIDARLAIRAAPGSRTCHICRSRGEFETTGARGNCSGAACGVALLSNLEKYRFC